MSLSKRRRGNVARLVAVILTVVIGIPLAMILVTTLTWQTTRVRAQGQDQLLVAESGAAVKEAVAAADDVDAMFYADPNFRNASETLAESASVFRPVTETVYEDQIVVYQEPVRDPGPGKADYVTRQKRIRTPRTVTTWVATAPMQGHGQEVRDLVKQLHDTKEDDSERDELLDKLREKLNEEFSKMHEGQAAQIAQAEERLEKLKATHKQRTDNRDKIVQRRIDQLLGQPDPWQWNVGPTPAPQYAPGIAPPSPARFELNSRNQWQSVPADSAAADVAAPPAPTPPTPPQRVPGVAPRISEVERTGQTVERTRRFSENQVPSPISLAGPPAVGRTPGRPQGFNAGDSVDVNVFSERVAVQSTPLGQMFEMLRTMADRKSDLEASERELERFERLKGSNAVANNEYEKVRILVEKLRRNVALMEMQLEATAAKLHHDLQAAEAAAAHANSRHAVLKQRFEMGTVPSDQVSIALNEQRKAENDLKSAKLSLDQFNRALKLIEGGEEKEVDVEVEADDTDDVEIEEEEESEIEEFLPF